MPKRNKMNAEEAPAVPVEREFTRRTLARDELAQDDPAEPEFAPPASIARSARTPPGTDAEEEKPTIAEIFGPGGAVEKCMPEGYEHRPSQLEMAELVEAAFTQKRHLIVEAGTGTGKTLAYLIPAIRSGRRVVISTATKSLQEQLF